MRKNLIKKLSIISMLIITFFIFGASMAKANTYSDEKRTDQEIEFSSPIKLADESDMKLDDSDKHSIYRTDYNVNKIGSKIVSYVTYICYGVAVIIVLIKGVQFMKAAPEAKAQVKEQLIAVAIGGVILFAVGSFIKIIAKIALNNLF